MSEKEEERERKEKIEKLKEEKRQMEEELDDLKGNTKKGKAVCALVGILAVVLLLGGITVLIKTDAGGVASSSLAPLIGDVPVARSILPKHLQRKTAKELAAQQAASQQAASRQNDTQKQADSQLAANAQNDSGTSAGTAQTDSQQAGVDSAQNNLQGTAGSGTSSTTDVQNASSVTGSSQSSQNSSQSSTQSSEEAALQDYVKTYSSMRPSSAAQVFDGMMPDQKHLIVKILKNMSASQRSAILASMNVQNASDITVEMNKELPGGKK